jgi:RNA-directed DNA polymerase
VVTWTRFNELLARHPLPPVKILHGYAAVSKSLS